MGKRSQEIDSRILKNKRKPVVVESAPFSTKADSIVLQLNDDEIEGLKQEHPDLVIRLATDEDINKIPEKDAVDIVAEILASQERDASHLMSDLNIIRKEFGKRLV